MSTRYDFIERLSRPFKGKVKRYQEPFWLQIIPPDWVRYFYDISPYYLRHDIYCAATRFNPVYTWSGIVMNKP